MDSIFNIKNQLAEEFVSAISQNCGISVGFVTTILVAIILWSLIWKFFGLWKSARNNSIIWFIVLALTNTLGILPILYIYVFSKIKPKKVKSKKIPKKRKKK